ncbi:MAG: peptidoglycan DD-metalloendopeptidase family protein, partial [Bacteroidota bacterium]
GACITEEARLSLIEQNEKQVKRLQTEGILSRNPEKQAVSFSWPLRAGNGLAFNSYYGISNYVDHNSLFSGNNNNNVSDFNCGTRSYDTGSGYNHKGTDYFTFPFPWLMMENDQVEVVAAAPGTITTKRDGNPDKNCDFSNNNWNIIIIQHSDGSRAWYAHLKTNSLTPKNVGDTVAEGEYLGVVGSSGASTGPHLHFEIYDTQNNLVDPYAGSCNNLNNSSWWQDQHAYYDSKINAILTQSAPPVFFDCPPTPRRLEITNEKTDFTPGDTIYFLSYYTDQRANMNTRHTLFRPDGSVYDNWNHSMSVSHYAWSYWWWWYVFPRNEMQGQWTYRTIFNGDTVSHDFNFGLAASIEPELDENLIHIGPNPFAENLEIDWQEAMAELPPQFQLEMTDMLGKSVFSQEVQASRTSIQFKLKDIAPGIYNLRIYEQGRSLIWRKRLMKE